MHGNPLARATFPRLELAVFRGRAALAAAEAKGPDREPMLRQAAAAMKAMRRISLPTAAPQQRLLAAALSHQRGDEESAAEHLRAAIEGFEALHMALYAAVARLRLGQLIGGDAGFTLRNRGITALQAEGVRAPGRFARVYAPGLG